MSALANANGCAGSMIQEQTRQALANCEAIVAAGGATLDDVVEVCVLLADPADFAGLNEEYARWFPVLAAPAGVQGPSGSEAA